MGGRNYRDIFKWGDPACEEKFDADMLRYIQETFRIRSEDMEQKHLPGLDEVRLKKRSRLSAGTIRALRKIAGADNVATGDFERAGHSYGKFYLDLVKLRLGIVDHPPDAVVYPRDERDVAKLVTFCHAKKIPLIPCGGHSSVTRGVEAPKGGVSLDLTKHMKRIIRVNEVNSSVTTESGVYGPALEEYLNGYRKGYTCGHFPQSFEFSTVGGWVVTRGAGQASTGYGKIEDIVLAIRVVTPRGIIETRDYPAASMGPDIDQIIMGSEGTFGVVTEVTMKIREYLPKNTAYTSFIYKDFDSAVRAMREAMQGQFGKPHLFRISDPEETDVAFKMKGKGGSLEDRALRLLGCEPGRRCLMFAAIEGDADHAALVKKKLGKIARANGGLAIGASPTKKWLEQRYSSAYLRDPLMDLGIMTDTLETAVSWDNLVPLWAAVRKYIKARPDTVCMVHISHCYENGANLYFTFLSPMKKGKEIGDYMKFQKGIVDTVHANHGSLSHHHGIGRMLAPWMKGEIGPAAMGMLQAIKDHLDPKGIMNPGGVLGLK